MDPPRLTHALEAQALDYVYAHGILLKHPTDPLSVTHAPFTLHPTPFPRVAFEQAINVQPLMNSMMHRVSLDDEFIHSAFSK